MMRRLLLLLLSLLLLPPQATDHHQYATGTTCMVKPQSQPCAVRNTGIGGFEALLVYFQLKPTGYPVGLLCDFRDTGGCHIHLVMCNRASMYLACTGTGSATGALFLGW